MRDKILATVTILLTVIFTCLMVYAIWQESTSSKMELNKSQWGCVKTETRMIPMLVGKVVVPQPRQECVEYKRN